MESVPKETETIAHKRAIRLSEKINAARHSLGLRNSWWTSEGAEMIGLGILVLLNFLLILPLIGQPALSTKFSGPVVPAMARLITFTGAPFMYSIQLVNVIFFLCLPISFYALVKFISGRKFAAFFSTLIASLPFYVFAKARVEFGLLSHESAYIASLSVMPIAITTLLMFLRAGGVKNLVVASLVSAFIALISPFGMFVFLITSGVTAFSEVLLGEGRVKILRLITILIFASSLTAFWYNPGLFIWMITGPLGSEIRSMISQVLPISFFVIPILACIGYLLFDRKPQLQPFFLALFYTLTFLIIVLVGGGLVPSNPGRYVPMLGLSLSFLIGITTLMSYEHLHFTKMSQFLPIKGTKDAFLLLVSIVLISITITSRNHVIDTDSKVLGAWTDVEKGDIWVARDKMSFGNSVPGYFISLTGAGTLFYLSKRKR